MRRVAVILLLLLALLATLIVTLPFSQPGSRLLATLVPKLAPVELEWGGGRLFGRFRVERFALEAGGVVIAVRGIDSALDRHCLWRSQLCLPGLQVAEVRVDVLEDAAGETDLAAGGTDMLERVPLLFPVQVVAPRVILESTAVRWPGGSWQQGRADFGLEMTPGGIHVSAAVIEDALLSVDSGEASPPARTELPEVWLPFEIAVAGLELVRPSWSLAGSEGHLERLVLQGNWSGHDLELDTLGAAHPEWGALALEGGLSFEEDWPLSAEAHLRPGPALAPPGTLEPGAYRLVAGGDLGALALELGSDGAHRIHAKGTVDTLDPALPYRVEGGLAWEGDLPLGDLLTVSESLQPLAFRSPLTLHSDGNLAVQNAEAGVTVSGLGYSDLAVALDLTHRDAALQVHRLALEEPGDGSAILASGSVAMADQVAADLQVFTPGLQLPAFSEYLFGEVQGKLAVALNLAPERWSVRLESLQLDGEVNGLPAAASGAMTLDSESYVAGGKLDFDINGARGRLRGRGEGRGAVVELDVADLGRWERGASGRLSVRATVAGTPGVLRFEGSLDEVGWQDWQLEGGDLTGRVDLSAPDQFELSLAAQKLAGPGLQLSTLSAQAQGGGERRELALDTQGDIEGDLRLVLRQQGGVTRGELAPTVLRLPVGTWELAEAVSLSLGADGLDVEAHCWRASDARLCLEQGSFGEAGQVSARLDGGIALLQSLLSEGVSLDGKAQASLEARWDAQNPLVAEARLNVGEGRVSQARSEDTPVSWAWDLLEAKATYADGSLVLDAGLQREGRRVIDLDARLPEARDEPLEGGVRFSGLQLSALQPFLPQLTRLEGVLEGDWQLAGTPAAPEASGQLRWRDGALAFYNSPTELTEVAVDVDWQGDDLALQGRGLMGGGEVRLEGGLRATEDWQLRLAVQGERNRIVYPPSVEVVVSPDLTVVARRGRVELRGAIDVDEGTLEQDQLPAGSVDLSSDVVEVDYAGNVIEEQQAFDASIDVRVNIDERFRVVGSGLDARVGGALHLQQQPGRPLQLYGNLNIVGGEYHAYGQHLEIKQGRISFAGVPENPELDVRAERDIALEQVSAGVRVSGTLEAPLLEIYSDPPMAQPEALSYLVRGRGLDAGAGGDGTALALSVGTGLVNRSAVVEGLNRLPGLSQVEFGAETVEDDTAATVSGYIGERIYLSYGVGLYEPVNVVTARLYLNTRLWLEVVSRLESSVDLYYRFEID